MSLFNLKMLRKVFNKKLMSSIVFFTSVEGLYLKNNEPIQGVFLY